MGDLEHAARDVADAAPVNSGIHSFARNVPAQPVQILWCPALDQFKASVKAGGVVKRTHPQRRQCAQSLPRPAVGAAHLQVFFEPHLGKGRGQMIFPVDQRRIFAR